MIEINQKDPKKYNYTYFNFGKEKYEKVVKFQREFRDFKKTEAKKS